MQPQLSLSKLQYDRIIAILSDLRENTNAQILLIDSSGLLIAKEGDLDQSTEALLATLAAADYAATNEMARIIGEQKGFRSHVHEGQHKNLYMAAIKPALYLVVVFSRAVTIGMVRVLCEKTCSEVEAITRDLDGLENNSTLPQNPDAGGEFEAELSSKLDAILGPTERD